MRKEVWGVDKEKGQGQVGDILYNVSRKKNPEGRIVERKSA